MLERQREVIAKARRKGNAGRATKAQRQAEMCGPRQLGIGRVSVYRIIGNNGPRLGLGDVT